jgi:hypothetical protein
VSKLFRRIKHGIHWRLDALRIFVRPRRAKMCMCWRHYFKSAARPHGLPAKLIVSLTSYRPRFDTLVYTLRSLLQQTVQPEHVILWISHFDFPFLPKNVLDLRGAGLEIRATTDLGPYTKIIPALAAFPDAFICTADDDVYYWPTWLEELVEEVGSSDHMVICHRAHEITLDSQGGWKPYDQWVFNTRSRGKLTSLFPTGVQGVLYSPGVLAHTPEDWDAALTLCPRADDIWLFWIGRRNGANYKTTRLWRELTLWPDSQKTTLWIDNVQHGGNDDQIRKMVDRYGYPRDSQKCRGSG